MGDEIAYFLTWTTYGTWLHGDRRGSVDAYNNAYGTEFIPCNSARQDQEKRRLSEAPLRLDPQERAKVEQAIAEHCSFRGWELVEVNCRSNHVHVIVKALNSSPDDTMDKLKARATRVLKQSITTRERFWTEGGSKRRIFNEQGLEAAIRYVRNQ